MENNYTTTLEKNKLQPILSMNEEKLNEVDYAIRELRDFWCELGKQSVAEYSQEKFKEYLTFSPKVDFLCHEFKFKEGNEQEILFWRNLISRVEKSNVPYYNGCLMRGELYNKDWTFTPTNWNILSALKNIDKKNFESFVRKVFSKITVDLYVELRKEKFLSQQCDNIYLKEISGSLHKCSLKALNAFYNHYKTSHLLGSHNTVKYDFLYAAFQANPTFYEKTLTEINDNRLSGQPLIALENVIVNSKYSKAKDDWTVKKFSLPTFEYGLKDRWFAKNFAVYSLKSLPHFQLWLNAYAQDQDMKTLIEKLLKQQKIIPAQALYEKHMLSQTIQSVPVAAVDRPKFKI